MFPAPGNAFTDASLILDRTISYLEVLGERVQTLHKKGRSPTEIRDVIFGQEATMSFAGQKLLFRDFTNNQFSTENIIHSFLKE